MQHFALPPALWITAIGLGFFGAALFAFRRRDLAMG
jgi:putative exporter of polyketide antibiotics